MCRTIKILLEVGLEQYYLSDHLGNQRVLFSDTNGDGSIDANTEVLQTTAYYPFGMEFEGNFTQNQGRENKYLFNGNELQDDFGLNTYDFVNRMYDPAIGRFWQIDKLAEDPMQIDKSPYAFGWNNPVTLNDPDGNCPKCFKALGKTVFKSVAKGKVDLSEAYDIAESVGTLLDGQLNMADVEAVFNLVSPVSTKELKAAKSFVEGAGDASKVVKAQKKLDKAAAGTKSNSVDYVVTPDGTAVNTSQSKMREGFDKAGFQKQNSTKTAESGQIHTVPTQHGNVDVRTMDGGAHHPKRAIFTKEGLPQQVKVGGKPFKGNEKKAVRRAESHLNQKN